jgi:hypothetical protein
MLYLAVTMSKKMPKDNHVFSGPATVLYIFLFIFHRGQNPEGYETNPVLSQYIPFPVNCDGRPKAKKKTLTLLHAHPHICNGKKDQYEKGLFRAHGLAADFPLPHVYLAC